MTSIERSELLRAFSIYMASQFTAGYLLYAHHIFLALFAWCIGPAYLAYYTNGSSGPPAGPTPPTAYWGGGPPNAH